MDKRQRKKKRGNAILRRDATRRYRLEREKYGEEASIPPAMAQRLTDVAALAGAPCDELGGKRRKDSISELEPAGARKRQREEEEEEEDLETDLDLDLSAMAQRDLLELDLFVSSHVERMKREMERQRFQQWSCVRRAVEKMMRAKDEEIAAAVRRGAAMERRLRALAAEGQTWMKLARGSAASAAALRREIELAKQQSGGGEVEDSTSGCEGGRSEGEVGVRVCGGCRRGEATRLVLPCRHLSLCAECVPGADWCPVCGSQKSAAIEVLYL